MATATAVMSRLTGRGCARWSPVLVPVRTAGQADVAAAARRRRPPPTAWIDSILGPRCALSSQKRQAYCSDYRRRSEGLAGGPRGVSTAAVPFQALDPMEYELPEHVASQLMTPALVVHMDKVRQNIQSMLKYVGGDAMRWRPHLKTTKSPRIWSELLDAGLRRFKVSTTREMAVLCEMATDKQCSAVDVILAYPLTGPALLRLSELADLYPSVTLSVLCEDTESVAEVPANLDIFVDVNVGMNRTGLPLEQAAQVLTQMVAAASSGRAGRFRGLHCYEGHLTLPDLEERTVVAHAVYDQVMSMIGMLEGSGHPVAEVITSGTPGFMRALSYRPFVDDLLAGVHQISPGTVVFHDLMVETVNPDVDLVPAAVLMARVVSRPKHNIITVDAGSKSIAAESGNPVAHVIGRPGWTPLKCSEEHLPIQLPDGGGGAPKRGELVALIPQHICPTVNLAEEMVLVEQSAVGGEKAYTVAPVSARGHELVLGGTSCYSVAAKGPCLPPVWKRTGSAEDQMSLPLSERVIWAHQPGH